MNNNAHSFMHHLHQYDSLFILLLTGFVIGLIAQWLMPGRGLGLLGTIAVGILGSWLGFKFIGQFLVFINDGWVKTCLSALTGAMLLVALINILRSVGGERRHGYNQ